MTDPWIDPADPLDTDAVLRRYGLLNAADQGPRYDLIEAGARAELGDASARMVMRGVPATDEEMAAALEQTGFVHTDPVADPRHPGITAADQIAPWPDQFPETWGENGPTERDQAAIDAAAGPS